jgi:hypothetical protein
MWLFIFESRGFLTGLHKTIINLNILQKLISAILLNATIKTLGVELKYPSLVYYVIK